MRLNDAPHASLCGLIVEEDATASIHLHVHKAGGKDYILREADRRTRCRLTRADALDPAL
jgi:hypothetical protein